MSPLEQLGRGYAVAMRREGSALPTPILSLRHRVEGRRCWWLLGRRRAIRIEVFRLEEAYVYPGSGFSLHFPVGTEFIASIPRPFWSAISPLDLSLPAVLAHDFLYGYGGRPPAGTVAPWDRTFTRLEADDLFLRINLEDQVETEKAHAAYRAVRECGASHWGSR